ncbi:occludin/ELL domain-containing protein 1 [Erinaceus europaeus]|uniref:Occludin/ELL domain-containing protein 1 n=1 Tax=Erinaceus europaeus TaxID=9365 RepID=A0ABM3WLE8_ERIEU|nr:occludin/ELL domain-containing protein 1 [Erinaceus europaeus]
MSALILAGHAPRPEALCQLPATPPRSGPDRRSRTAGPRRLSGSGPGSEPRTLGQAACRAHPPRAGPEPPRRPRPPAGRRPPRTLAPRELPQTRCSRGRRHALQPGSPRAGASTLRPPGQPPPGAHKPRPKKIVFEDELPLRTGPCPVKPPVWAACRPGPPHPAPDYELRYPPPRSTGDRERYAAVFRDLHPELRALRRDLRAACASLRRLEALLAALPPPRSQAEAQLAARVHRQLRKKQADPYLLARQARCQQLQAKLKLLKSHIQKFDASQDDGSVYF